jgi:hypothetical protein
VTVAPTVGATAAVVTNEYWNPVAERPTGDTIAVPLIEVPPDVPATVNFVPGWNAFVAETTTGV